MKYTVARNGPLEIHTIELHEVDQAFASDRLNKDLYRKLSSSEKIAERIAALSLIAKVIELIDEYSNGKSDSETSVKSN